MVMKLILAMALTLLIGMLPVSGLEYFENLSTGTGVENFTANVISGKNYTFEQFATCTLKTDSDGIVLCGSDNAAAGGSQWDISTAVYLWNNSDVLDVNQSIISLFINNSIAGEINNDTIIRTNNQTWVQSVSVGGSEVSGTVGAIVIDAAIARDTELQPLTDNQTVYNLTLTDLLVFQSAGNLTDVAFVGDLSGNYGGTVAIAANAVVLATDTTGNFIATITGDSLISVGGSGSENAAATLTFDSDPFTENDTAFNITLENIVGFSCGGSDFVNSFNTAGLPVCGTPAGGGGGGGDKWVSINGLLHINQSFFQIVNISEIRHTLGDFNISAGGVNFTDTICLDGTCQSDIWNGSSNTDELYDDSGLLVNITRFNSSIDTLILQVGSGNLTGENAGGDLTGTYPNPTINANAVELGTDTTGNYVATVTGDSLISVAGSGSETAAITLTFDSSPFTENDTIYNSTLADLLVFQSAGNLTGASAGGDLTGTYPSPTIAADVVDGTELADTITLDVLTKIVGEILMEGNFSSRNWTLQATDGSNHSIWHNGTYTCYGTTACVT